MSATGRRADMQVDMVTMRAAWPVTRRALQLLQHASRLVGALADGPPVGRRAGAEGADVECGGAALRCDHLEPDAVGTPARAAAGGRATRSPAYAEARGAYRLISCSGLATRPWPVALQQHREVARERRRVDLRSKGRSWPEADARADAYGAIPTGSPSAHPDEPDGEPS